MNNWWPLIVIVYILGAWFSTFLSKAFVKHENDTINVLVGLFWPIIAAASLTVIVFQIFILLLKIIFSPALLIGKIAHDRKFPPRSLRDG